MLPPVFQTLKASAEIKAIVGTNPPRIFRHGEAPQDITKPYITWFVISGVPENNLSDLPPTDRSSVQVDCWHPTDTGVELLARAVRDAAELVTHMTAWRNSPREAETRLYRISMDFDFWGR